MTIGVYIGSQLTGFFASLAKELATTHKVVVVAQSSQIKEIVIGITGLTEDCVVVESEFEEIVLPNKESVISECLAREDKYGILFSELCIYDRAVGRGYLFNADYFPDVARAWWSTEKKWRYLLGKIAFAEYLRERYDIKLFISIVSVFYLAKVFKHYAIPYLTFYPVKLGKRMLWADDETATSSKLRAHIQTALLEEPADTSGVSYLQEFTSAHNHSTIKYAYGTAVREASRVLAINLLKAFRGQRKRDSYPIGGWIPSILNKPRIYSYFEKWGFKPHNLENAKFVYLPLSYEPEISLYGYSPEFNNTQEMIALVSRALPADMMLVIKEQPFAYGMRSRKYYDYLRQMPNVILAHPSITSLEWVKASSLVATVTGTVGIEAVYFRKPVLVFGKDHLVRELPVARYVRFYSEVRKGIRDLMKIEPHGEEFTRSIHALNTAQVAVSIDMPGFEKIYRSSDPQPEHAFRALEKLKDTYPHIFYSLSSKSAID